MTEAERQARISELEAALDRALTGQQVTGITLSDGRSTQFQQVSATAIRRELAMLKTPRRRALSVGG